MPNLHRAGLWCVCVELNIGAAGSEGQVAARWYHAAEAAATDSGGDSSQREQLRSVQPIHATHKADVAFAALTWGDPECGGDSSLVQDLRDVQPLKETCGAFAAIVQSGAAVTWGHPLYGVVSLRCLKGLA